jgi:formate dehydrogenase maturation protein FdhE
MRRSVSPESVNHASLKALERRADAIRKARPAYNEILDFYLIVFRRQIEWRGKLVVNPETVDGDQRRECLREGHPLVERFDPGIESESLLRLWAEMKNVFLCGNDVLRQAVEKIDSAENAGDFAPGTWLLEQRPDRFELVSDTAAQIEVDQNVLATLARTVTLPHWELVSDSWLGGDPLHEWKRFTCPTCGGLPGLAETRKTPCGTDGLTAAYQRLMHCSFCGSFWAVPTLECPACGSTKEGDAKYFFTADEPEWRIDFCKSCDHYVKVIDGDKISRPIHVGLELVTAAHLDVIARGNNLSPLEVCC